MVPALSLSLSLSLSADTLPRLGIGAVKGVSLGFVASFVASFVDSGSPLRNRSRRAFSSTDRKTGGRERATIADHDTLDPTPCTPAPRISNLDKAPDKAPSFALRATAGKRDKDGSTPNPKWRAMPMNG